MEKSISPQKALPRKKLEKKDVFPGIFGRFRAYVALQQIKPIFRAASFEEGISTTRRPARRTTSLGGVFSARKGIGKVLKKVLLRARVYKPVLSEVEGCRKWQQKNESGL